MAPVSLDAFVSGFLTGWGDCGVLKGTPDRPCQPMTTSAESFGPDHGAAIAAPAAVCDGLDDARLCRFDPIHASAVALWVRSDVELRWIAPGTPPPLTDEKVAGWSRNPDSRYVIQDSGQATPSGYGELEFMPGRTDQMWIGHLVVDPRFRGTGLGSALVRRLVGRAFSDPAIGQVLLVVSPDNDRAIRCYRRAGFEAVGRERRHFKTTGVRIEFLQMAVGRGRFSASGSASVRSGRSGLADEQPLPER